jgi:nucleotide-binding universal stress UspA family protein
VLLDGSALAEQILPYVGSLAQIPGPRVRLLHVIAEPEHASLIIEGAARAYGADEELPTRKEYMRRACDIPSQPPADYLAIQAMRLRATGIGMDVEDCLGSPSEGIVEHAVREPDTLVALATHGYSGLRRWALGSVADSVLHSTMTPLLLVRAQNRSA